MNTHWLAAQRGVGWAAGPAGEPAERHAWAAPRPPGMQQGEDWVALITCLTLLVYYGLILFYALFVVSRITILCQIIRHF